MSLINAKRTADLREQVSQGAKKLEQMHDEIRRGITAEVMAEFETYLGSNGFALSPTLKGKKATYKDLTIELRPGTEAYFGAYHTFTLMMAGKEIYVRVLAKFSGDVERTPLINASELEKLERELASIEKSLQGRQLEAYSFESALKLAGNQKHQFAKHESITEVINHFSA